MARLTIRNLDSTLATQLAFRGALNARTPSEEARAILRQALTRPEHDQLGDRLHHMCLRYGGAELDLPARTAAPRVPQLANPPRLPEDMA